MWPATHNRTCILSRYSPVPFLLQEEEPLCLYPSLPVWVHRRKNFCSLHLPLSHPAPVSVPQEEEFPGSLGPGGGRPSPGAVRRPLARLGGDRRARPDARPQQQGRQQVHRRPLARQERRGLGRRRTLGRREYLLGMSSRASKAGGRGRVPAAKS